MHLKCTYIYNTASQMLTLYPSRCKHEGTGGIYIPPLEEDIA